MLTIIVMVVIWSLLSLPLSVVLGLWFRDDSRELVGMDGDAVVFRRSDGALERVQLIDRAAA